MPNYDEMFPSKYVSAADLALPGGGYREVRLRIASFAPEQLKARDDSGKLETKWIMYFDRAQKGMILNRTNAETIAAGFGKNTDQWVGREVVLFVMTVQSPRGLTPAVRVRIPQPTLTTGTSPAAAGSAGTFAPPSDAELDKIVARESEPIPF